MIRGLEVKFDQATINRALANVREVLESGKLIHNKFIPEFEDRIEALTGLRAQMFASDTCAQECLYAATKMEGVVVVPGTIFSSPVFAMQRAGLQIEWCDVDPWTTDLDLEHLSQICKKQSPKLVVVSSLGGQLLSHTNRLGILQLQKQHDFVIMEDAAHSFGSRRGDIVSGGWADFSVFCFAATKTLGFGLGGVLTGRSPRILGQAAMYARYGREALFGSQPSHVKGFSHRMSESQAAIGCAVLDNLEASIDTRQKLAAAYISRLRRYGGLYLFDYGESNFYKFPISLPTDVSRDDLRDHLETKGIGLSALCSEIPTYRQKAFRNAGEFEEVYLPGCEEYCLQHVCLPMHEWLDESDVMAVCDAVEEFL